MRELCGNKDESNNIAMRELCGNESNNMATIWQWENSLATRRATIWQQYGNERRQREQQYGNNMAMRETCGFEEKSNKMANYSDVSASNSKHVSLYIREPGDALVTAIYQINPVIVRAFFFTKVFSLQQMPIYETRCSAADRNPNYQKNQKVSAQFL